MNVSFSKRNNLLLEYLGHISMILLICLAYVLWLERSTTFDSSLYGYMMITREAVYTPHDRWINYLWQWMPILAVKLGVSLSTFLKVMSVAPILFLYAVFNVIAYGFKNRLAGIYFVLTMVVLIRYKFYSAIPEIYLGTAFVALMVALLTRDWAEDSKVTTIKKMGVGFIILLLNLLGHPLLFFPMGVVILLDYLIKGDWKSVFHFALMASCACLFLIKYLIGRGSSHEGGIINNFFASIGSGNFLETTTNLYSLEIFGYYAETQWAFPLVLILAMLGYLLFKKKYLFVFALLSSCAIWVIFVAHLVAYLKGPYFFMIEGYYLLISPIIFLPLMYIKWKEEVGTYLLMPMLVVLIGFGLHRIYTVRPFYTERIADMNTKIQAGLTADARNIIAPAGPVMWDKYWYLWSVPFESLFHSSLQRSEETSILIIDTYPDKAYFEKPLEVMVGVPTDTLHEIKTPYFKFDSSPFIQIE